MGVGWRRQGKLTPGKDKLSFVPQWTIDRLTRERNSKSSCLNRLKLEGGKGRGKKEKKGRERGLPGEAT